MPATALAFALAAAVQAGVTCGVAYGLLGLYTPGGAALVIGVAVLDAVLGMAIGLLVSAFATSEFQAVQFMPAVVMPQILLGGLFVPRDQMADVLDAVSSALPLTYAYEGLSRVTTGPGFDGTAWRDLAIVLVVTLLALALGATTLRRRTA